MSEKKAIEHTRISRLSKNKREAICKAIHDEVIANEGYLQQGLTAQQVAQKHGFSAQDMSAVTAVYFGGNFSMLLQRLRVSYACKLLANKAYSGVNCDVICQMSGFSNKQSLYNAFRRQIGMTPVQYRLKHFMENE